MKKEFEYNVENKEFLAIFKLFSSSLFARKQRYLYICKDTPYECYYSTMLPESIMFNKPTIDDVVHKVVSKKYNVFKLFEQYLPFEKLNTNWFCINLLETATLIRENITKDKIFSTTVSNDDNTQIGSIKIRKVDKEDTEVFVPVLHQIGGADISLLSDTVASITTWVDNQLNIFVNKLDTLAVMKGDINYIKFINCVYPNGTHVATGVNIPRIDGFSTVSVSEYVKKQNIGHVEDKPLQLVVGQFGNIVRMYYKYIDDSVEVISTHPAAFFYSKI